MPKKNKESVLSRVEAEREELAERISKLQAYLASGHSIGIGYTNACHKRLNAMVSYHTALNNQITFLRAAERQQVMPEDAEAARKERVAEESKLQPPPETPPETKTI